jgi:hypothetical protein
VTLLRWPGASRPELEGAATFSTFTATVRPYTIRFNEACTKVQRNYPFLELVDFVRPTAFVINHPLKVYA